MSPLAYLARYTAHGQHRRGRLALEDRHRAELEALRERRAARRRHPAGRRLGAAT